MSLSRKYTAALILTLTILFLGAPAWAGGKKLMMATTTSTDNTGLLEYLIPAFTQEKTAGLKQ